MDCGSIIVGCWWLSASVVAYPYVIYPVLIAACARLWPDPIKRGDPPGRCTVIISAYNEAKRLPMKIQTMLRSSDQVLIDRILIGSDGSTDDTVERLRAIRDTRVTVFAYPERRGKPSVLNDLVTQADSDFLVMTDARQVLADGAIARLLGNFADPRVGVVSGELFFRTSDSGTDPAGMRRYWDFEKWIRANESAFRSVPGVTGAFYAMRRSQWSSVPACTVLDDLWVPMQVIRRRLRCVLDRTAWAFDQPSTAVRSEALRKRRTLAGVIQCIRLIPSVMRMDENPIWWEFMSHKFGRFAAPFGMIGLLVAGAFSGGWITWVTLAGIALAAISGFVHLVLRGHAGWWGLPWSFVRMNAVALAALRDGLSGRMRVTWEKTS